MSKKNKSVRVKLIANPGAGNAADAAENLRLVTGSGGFWRINFSGQNHAFFCA